MDHIDRLEEIADRLLKLLQAEQVSSDDALFVTMSMVGGVVVSETCPACRQDAARDAKRMLAEMLADVARPHADDTGRPTCH